MDFAYTDKVKAMQAKLIAFMDEHIYPNEHRFHQEVLENRKKGNPWIPTKIIEELKLGRTLQVCFKNPGHYVALVNYEEETDKIVYNDSLKGFNLRAQSSGFLSLLEPYAILYYRKDEQK